MKLVWKQQIGGFDIRLVQKTNSMFKVIYGKQVNDNLEYRAAATALGESIMHACASEGLMEY